MTGVQTCALPIYLQLDPPQYRITLNDTALQFGGIEPLKYRRYIKTGDTVYLVDDQPSAALDKDYADLVAKSVIPEGSEIVGIDAPKLRIKPDNKDAAPVFAAWKNAKSMWNELATATDGGRDKTGIPAESRHLDVLSGGSAARGRMPEPPTDAKNLKGDAVTVTLKDRVLKFVIAERDPQFKLYSPDLGIRYVLSKAVEDEMLKLPEAKQEKNSKHK